MYPYHELGFFSFLMTLWTRCLLFITGQLRSSDLVTEDMQLLALLASGLIGLFLGFYLIYNNLTMMANSLSHTILLSLILVFFTASKLGFSLGIDNIPFVLQMIAAVITTGLTSLSIKYLSRRMFPEAANAFSFTAFFALGILLSSLLLKNTHLGLESVLGNLEAVVYDDVLRLFGGLFVVLALVFFFRSKLMLISFDTLFAKTLGIKAEMYRLILVLVASLALMLCFRSLGVILILSLLTSPVLCARQFFSSQKKIFVYGMGFVILHISLCLGLVQMLYVNFNLPVSTGGLFGFLGLFNYGVALLIKKATTSLRSRRLVGMN